MRAFSGVVVVGMVVGLWVSVAAELALVLLIVRRLGGLTRLVATSGAQDGVDRLHGTKIPPLRVRVLDDNLGRQRAQRVWFDEGTIIVLVRPRCVASRRLLAGLSQRLNAGCKPEFPMVVGFVGDIQDVNRLLGEFDVTGFAVMVINQGFVRKIDDAIPCAISLGAGGVIQHVASIDGDDSVFRFAEASGSAAVRQWLERSMVAAWPSTA